MTGGEPERVADDRDPGGGLEDAAAAPSAGAPTFEELMSELEEITDRLAAGDLGIEAAVDLYERAERLHAQATERLDQIRDRVAHLIRPEGPTG
jgi:exodeoxyribonuclease VII small subunit